MDTIGNFHILKELGRGRMAVVYLVEDTDGCQYALKLLHPSFATEQGVKLIQREAAINRRLFHPSIIRVIDYKKFSPDYHCLIMEYAEGRDLGKYLEKKKQLSIQDTLEIAWDICNALEFAHSWGVIHRDIKPQNIIFGKDKTIRITDFGLARATTSSISSLAIGTAIGTPYYISPEQASGQKGDERSDLYSLGVTMYQMLTGKVPFDANNELVLLDMHRRETPQPILAIRPKVPPRLVELVNKAMAKSPSDRFQSARAMSQAIKEVAEQEGIVLEKRTPSEPLWRRIQKILLWPHTHWPDVVTELWANIIWAALTSVLVLAGGITLSVYGMSGEKLLAFFNATPTVIPTDFPATFTSTPPPTKTPNIKATQAAATVNFFATQTAEAEKWTPTPTDTPTETPTTTPDIKATQAAATVNFFATQTAEAEKWTPTPTDTPTETPSATPDVEATQIAATANFFVTQTAEAEKWTATPTPTRTPTKTPIPTSTSTRRPTAIPKPPTRTPRPTVIPTSTPRPPTAIPTKTNVLFYQDYEVDDGSFDFGVKTDDKTWRAETSLVDGKYRLTYTRLSGSATRYYNSIDADGSPFKDFVLSMEITPVDGPYPLIYGVGLRLKSNNSGYTTGQYDFFLNNKSQYKIGVLQPGNGYKTLIDWTEAGTIKNDDTNKIAVIAIGSQFSFYVNDQLLTNINDGSIDEGGIYFFVAHEERQTPITIDVDNVIVKSPN